MHALSRSTLGIVLCLAFTSAACSSKRNADESEESDSKSKKRKKKDKKSKKKDAEGPTSAASAKAAAEPAKPPSPVDLDKMTWTQGGKTIALAKIDMKKRCFLKNLEMVLPADTSIKPLMGQRGCIVRPWGEGGSYIAVVSDEIKTTFVPMNRPKDLKGDSRVIEETSESYLANNVDRDPPIYGSLQRKVAQQTIHCLVSAKGTANDIEAGRGLLQLCATMAPMEPAPTPP